MTDHFAASVKGITKALDTGIKLAKRVSRSASDASAGKALQILESAKSLQRDLEGNSQVICDAYTQVLEACGEQPFTKALIEDQQLQDRLKDLRIDLIDQINECQDFDEEPESFNQIAFTNVQHQSEKCTAECIDIFNGIRDRLLQRNLQSFTLEQKDDRAQLSSMRQGSVPRKALATPPSRPASLAPVSPLESGRPSLSIHTPSDPARPVSPWRIESPAQFDIGSPIGGMSASFASAPKRSSRDISPNAKVEEGAPRLIPKEHINYRLSANEEFLERRRQSRILFQRELQSRQSIVSAMSIEENRASEVFSDRDELFMGSPRTVQSSLSGPSVGRASSPTLPQAIPQASPSSRERKRASSPTLGQFMMPASPIAGSRTSGSGYDELMTKQRSQRQMSQGSRDSRTGSIVQPLLHRQGSQASQESIFGLRNAPLSPPLSESRDSWGPIATTLKTPDFGRGVEPGIEVVSPYDHENGLMLANENEPSQPTPTASVKSIDHPMRHDSSFYKFGGFCEGAKAVMRGEVGFKVVKRPAGQFSSTKAARCTSCSYEVGWKEFEKDTTLSRDGIYGHTGIRFRQRFLSKCHIRTDSVDQPLYGCIFCIKEHKTIEEHDATVFFSVAQFFHHLAKHSQPLPSIEGVTTIYGYQQPSVVDFDIHFTKPEAIYPQFCMKEIASKVATRPSATALTTHHPKPKSAGSIDPVGNMVLHFAANARIVGITFPDELHGTWCVGYHDGQRGSFPASSVALELPVREDVLMNAQSSLVAFAKWDFKPKESRDGGWLSFKRGEKISAVGYTFQDQWCWSGQIRDSKGKGKWGLFPASFVDNLQEAGNLALSPSTSTPRSGFGAFGRIGSTPLGRMMSSKHERSASLRSNGSGGSGNRIAQPGLEVVTHTNSWTRN